MKRLPLSGLQIFNVTANCTSFTNAAQILCITQGAVSKQIKQLEDYLDVKLFERHAHSIALTASGIILKKYLDQAFKRMYEGISVVKNNPKMYLKIAASPTFATRWLAVHLANFHYQYPFVEITLIDYQPQNKYGKNVDTKIDCEIIYAESSPSEQAYLLMLEKNIAVCAAHLFELEIPKIFIGHQLLHILNNQETPLSLWKDWCAQANFVLDTHSGLFFSTQDQVINAAINGLGVAILDKNMIEVQLKTLWLFPLTSHVLEGPFGYWLVCKQENKKSNPAIQLFETWIKSMV